VNCAEAPLRGGLFATILGLKKAQNDNFARTDMLATDASNKIKGCLLVGNVPNPDLSREWSKDRAAESWAFSRSWRDLCWSFVIAPPVSPFTGSPCVLSDTRTWHPARLQPVMTPVPGLRRGSSQLDLPPEQEFESDLAATA
jgi:hypothetical protein